MADLANLVGEGVRGHRVVKAFGMERFEDERFRGATERHLRVNLWAQMLSAMSSPVVESMAAIFAVALLIYAGFQIRAGELSPSLLVAFLLNLFWMYDPIRKLNKVNLVLQQSLAADPSGLRPDGQAQRDRRSAGRAGARDGGAVDHLRRHLVRLRPARVSCTTSISRSAGRGRGAGRPVRRRQDHPGQPAAALLRPRRGAAADRRRRHPRGLARPACAR